MLFLFRSSPETGPDQKPQSANNTSGLRFRWRYIALPLIIFVLTIALVAYFYRLLPEESGPVVPRMSGQDVLR